MEGQTMCDFPSALSKESRPPSYVADDDSRLMQAQGGDDHSLGQADHPRDNHSSGDQFFGVRGQTGKEEQEEDHFNENEEESAAKLNGTASMNGALNRMHTDTSAAMVANVSRVDSASPKPADVVDKVIYTRQELAEGDEHWKQEYLDNSEDESPGYNNDRSTDAPSPYNSEGGLNSSYLSDDNSCYNPDTVLPNKEGIYFCHLCSFSGRNKVEFDAHMTCHFEHICPHCDYKSRTEGRLKRHIKDFHTEDPPDGFGSKRNMGRPKVFRCKQCDYVATEKEDFWSHARSHIKDDKLLQCPKCPFVTEYKHHLEYHLRNHFGSKPFKCGKCNYSCVNKSMLNSHMKSHTNVYQYRCADCTYATKYCHSLKLHLRKYNHKPATVLNTDGSLPQGIDAEASGLSLMQKRGPPRGPRVPRKDKFEPYLSHLMPMPHGSLPGMSPGLNGSLMSPYWPILNQFPNGLHGPPPLVPASSHLGSSLHPELMSKEFQRDPSLSRIMTNAMKHVHSDLPFKCSFCSFTTDSKHDLLPHVKKSHMTEYQNLMSVFGMGSERLLEDHLINNMGNNSRMFSPNKRPMSDELPSPQIKTEPQDSLGSSPHSWPTQPPSKLRKIEDSSFYGFHSKASNYASFGQDRESPGKVSSSPPIGGEDIIKQMMHKFGSGLPPSNAKPFRESSPLDLTKPRSPLAFSPLTAEAYRRSLELRMEDTNDGNTSSGGENSASEGQRKRSRKGKAFKLDTLCMKLQEKQEDGREQEEEMFSDADDMDNPVTIDHREEVDYQNGECDEPIPRGRSTESDICEDMQRKALNNIHKNLAIMNEDLSGNKITREEPKEDREEDTQSITRNNRHEDLDRQESQTSETPSLNLNSQHSGSTEDHEDLQRRESADSLKKGENGFKCDAHITEHQSNMQFRNAEEEREIMNAINLAQSRQREMGMKKNMEMQWRMMHDRVIPPVLHNGFSMNDMDSPLKSHTLGPLTHPYTSTPKVKNGQLVSHKYRYECNSCEIGYSDSVQYTDHMRYHDSSHPFKCKICGHCCRDKVDFCIHISRGNHT